MFWRSIGLKLQESGHKVSFISFDDRSTEMLRHSGFKVFNSSKDIKGIANLSILEEDKVFEKFGVNNLDYWLNHECIAFNQYDKRKLRKKLINALMCADNACADLSKNGQVVMIQELGGFLSVIGSFFAARHNKIDNWFIEPSFFRGRVFFIRNSFRAKIIENMKTNYTNQEVEHYINKTIEEQVIVIPIKDKHHYLPAYRKVINFKNIKRLFQKLFDKYLFGKKQEFDGIFNHAFSHLRMMYNSYLLSNDYVELNQYQDIIYFPLHVPGDMALTIRAPHLLDQLELVNFICSKAPPNYLVLIKEHPAMIGAFSASRVKKLFKTHKNLRILHPSINNFDVLNESKLVISINSKSGAEAGMLGKKVILMGNSFYDDAPFVKKIDKIDELEDAMCYIISSSELTCNKNELHHFFASVWDNTVPGEIYSCDTNNIDIFSRSIQVATQ